MANAPRERTEGWGSLDNARDAHYFNAKGQSLCGRWFTFGPRWERNQELGTEATKGTCKACWKKRAKIETAQFSKSDGPEA